MTPLYLYNILQDECPYTFSGLTNIPTLCSSISSKLQVYVVYKMFLSIHTYAIGVF